MGHRMGDQMRALLIPWLVLTVPVVCHHETAVVLFGALVPDGAHTHATRVVAAHVHAAAEHDHGGAATLPEGPVEPALAGRLALAAQPLPTPGALAPFEWCAHATPGGARVLPEGLDSACILLRPLLALGDGLGPPAEAPDGRPPVAHAIEPPAPPPRSSSI
jgi:hypothetical protein